MSPQEILEQLLKEAEHKREQAHCKTCFDERRIVNGGRMDPCPDCCRDSLEDYGFKISGEVLRGAKASELVKSAKIKELLKKEPAPCVIYGATGQGKTVFMKWAFNYFLDKLRFREKIFYISEVTIIRMLREGNFDVLRHNFGRASAVLIDEAFRPRNWQDQERDGDNPSKIFNGLFDLFDYLYESRNKTVLMAGNGNPEEIVKDAALLRRIKEIARNNLIKI